MEKNIREVVKQRYAKAISSKSGSCCCAGSRGGCCNEAEDPITANLYGKEETKELPADIVAQSFGCGNPTALAELNSGEVVLDLGSGAGLDVLLSARRVGPTGKAYGLDMTDEMLAVARANQTKAGMDNVEFLKGYIEDIPLPDNTVDVIISNCVINLSGDKDKVLKEAFRVLRPGGRFAVSDIVLKKPLPEKVQRDLLAWAGCVAGALLEKDYVAKLEASGFTDIEIQVTRDFGLSDLTNTQAEKAVRDLSDLEREQLNGAIVSAFVKAKKLK